MPADGPIGIRHIGGVTLIQALVRNLGTCRSDVKGEIQVEGLLKDESTDAGHRGGDALPSGFMLRDHVAPYLDVTRREMREAIAAVLGDD
jgi:hypothetical protein